MHAKDKEIMAAAKNIEEELLAHADIVKSLEGSRVLSTRAMKSLAKSRN